MEIITVIKHSPELFCTVTVLFGLLVGSFLNVVIHRLPLMMERAWREECAEALKQPLEDAPKLTLWGPRSHCPHCGHLIGAFENIPLISYLLQRGRCAHCQSPISWQYPAVELASGLLAAIVALHFGFGGSALAGLIFTWILLAASGIDIRHQLLPDQLTLLLLWLGLLVALLGWSIDLQSAVIGAMVGYLSLWSVYQIFRLITGREGMGYGDFKLLAALGAWVGWSHLISVILISSLIGAIVGIWLILFKGRDRQVPIPFGPFLAIAGWITLLWGEPIHRFYWSIW